MGLFFNYDKPGPGVDKNAPQKKGIFLYFELLIRKFPLLIKANLLYVLVSLPVMFLYDFVIFNTLLNVLPEYKDVAFHLSLVFTTILTFLWGTGPASCGYTYILRNFVRDEHAWITSDFFEKIKENIKIGIVMLILDLLILILGINAAGLYFALIKSGVGFAKYGLALLFGVLMIYTFMHYYVYELAVTFQNKTFGTIKNALIMSVAMLPANLFLTVFSVACTFLLFSFISSFGVILIVLILWISLMRFPIDFYSARMIKRRFIRDETDDEESVD